MESEDSGDSCDEPDAATKKRPFPPHPDKDSRINIHRSTPSDQSKNVRIKTRLTRLQLSDSLTATTTEKRRIIKHRHRPLVNRLKHRKKNRQENQRIQIVMTKYDELTPFETF